MNKSLSLSLACLLLGLAACGSNDQDQAAATKAPPPGTGPVQISKSNVFSPLVQDLNKAKALNGQVQQQAKGADQSIETQSMAPAAATTTDQP
jgi:hypothetical protein